MAEDGGKELGREGRGKRDFPRHPLERSVKGGRGEGRYYTQEGREGEGEREMGGRRRERDGREKERERWEGEH